MQGVEVWNKWISEHTAIRPDFYRAELSNADLSGAEFDGADLSGAILDGANLSKAKLTGAYFVEANLSEANLKGADLRATNLSGANFRGADLRGALLRESNLSRANLKGANLNLASVRRTVFDNIDLREVEGLENMEHLGPSEISFSTMYRSGGQIPQAFLRGCGVPDSLIVQIPSLVASVDPIQFYSCFISYSHKDEEFAERLFSRMRQANLRVWYAPEEIKGGQKIHEQIFSAIQLHDKLLLVLSENSLKSEWVATEIRRARKVEREETRRKLFPIRLVDFDAVQNWECFDADSGKDLAIELREYFMPDFSNWKDHDSFEKAFDRLLRDLKAEEK
jgi:hypothetical protein